jgi:hypothetical protein
MNSDGILTKEDLIWLRKISIMKCGFFFYFKIMCRVAAYSEAARMYKPRKIFCSAEYSFTSSLLTAFCENMGVEHVNVMHGEKIFELKDAFSRFSRFYVWDEEYAKLFHRLRANKTTYIIEPKQPIDLSACDNGRYTYYLQSETIEQLKCIKQILESLNADYVVRPHPVYGTDSIYKIFDKDHIEDYKQISLAESLNNSEFAVSVNSTVLYEAFLSGRKVIIDDVSNPKLYSDFKKRDYIMMNKKHILLSSIVKFAKDRKRYA